MEKEITLQLRICFNDGEEAVYAKASRCSCLLRSLLHHPLHTDTNTSEVLRQCTKNILDPD